MAECARIYFTVERDEGRFQLPDSDTMPSPLFSTASPASPSPSTDTDSPPSSPTLSTSSSLSPPLSTAPSSPDTTPHKTYFKQTLTRTAIPRPMERITKRNAATGDSFFSPAIQAKLRQQSVLYHEINDLLATFYQPATKDLPPTIYEESESDLELDAESEMCNTPPAIPDHNDKDKEDRKPPAATCTVDSVDRTKIEELKKRYPNRTALHKHLDTYAAVMGRFMARGALDAAV
ncbi:hypothetical protein Dda_9118 [Drechslerella dactyloides]|uniref:Uncharacterized protein n=1 Tax=Drechslerella dactyloides TaxID=74499 RepID=A0AAD6IPS2_DREDA|nr:hypothetical protein Dda_9118 [Drechslerella dactyloides]